MAFFREQVMKGLIEPYITHKRSSKWPKVRKAYLKKNPTCEACGRKNSLEIHHKIPFNLDHTLELEHSNLITLCSKGMECHISWGHLGNYKYYNPNIEKDSKAFLHKVKNRLPNK